MDNPGWNALRWADKELQHRRRSTGLQPEDFAESLPDGGWLSSPASILREGLARLPPAERAKRQRTAHMNPSLHLMVGPLLRYDTIDQNGVWHGAALIVTADSGSFYEPSPVLKYRWQTEGSERLPGDPTTATFSQYHLAPHPADPHTVAVSPVANLIPPDAGNMNGNLYNGLYRTQSVTGDEIYVYNGHWGTFTFWRFMIRINLEEKELCIRYSINGGMELCFYVPARSQNMRWAAHSCNGFSAGINPDDFRGPGFRSGYDPMWVDLLQKHSEAPFHVLVGGGDQLYCDSIIREPELQDWIHQPTPAAKKSYQLTPEILMCLDRFYFNHYCTSFRHGAFARANSSIPMLNMCDDHDLIDGFGSYPEDLQSSPVFQAIGARGYFFFLLFQCFINPALDGLDSRPGCHPFKSLLIGAEGPYVKLPSHSFLSSLGPTVCILMLDCRAERTKDRVCSDVQYQKIIDAISKIPSRVEHLVVLLGVPIAYPRLVFLETALDFKFNPLVALGKMGALGLSGFVNKFDSKAELLDDLNDHWTSKGHKNERNLFIQRLQRIAKSQYLRISFLSGDVHCAAVGVLKTFVQTGTRFRRTRAEVSPEVDWRYMLNVVTSAIVNTPPPAAVINMVSTLATKTHKTLHHAATDEAMLPIFTHEPNGAPRAKNKYIMGRRNWCAMHWDNTTGDLVFDLRVEKEKGVGTSVGYMVRAPPPRWEPST